MNAFPSSFIDGMGVFKGGLVMISNCSMKIPGISDKKLKAKVIYSPGLMTLLR